MNSSELFLSFVRRVIGAFLLVLVVAMAGHAQGDQTVRMSSKEVAVFTNQTTNASSAVFPDNAYGCSFLPYQTSAFVGTIDVEWAPPVPVGTTPTYIQLAEASYSSADTSSTHVLQVGGYFPNMRSTVTVSAGSLNAEYTASSSPCPLYGAGLASNGPAPPITCDKNLTFTAANGSTQTLILPLQTGDTVILCGATVSFAAATTTGNVQIFYSALTGCGSVGTVSWYGSTTSATPQIFNIPFQIRSALPSAYPYSCWVNNSGSTATISISYASVHGL
jgi:hypothetical protein